MNDGRPALGRVHRERFDIVISDLLMPGMTGMELFEHIRSRAPDVAERMVFMTGGAFTPRTVAFLDSVPNPRFEKPIDRGELRALVARLLATWSPVPR